MKPLLPAFAAAALLAGGCASVPSAPESIDFRETIQKAEKAVFPALVYIRVVCKDLSSGKDEKGVVQSAYRILVASSKEKAAQEADLLMQHLQKREQATETKRDVVRARRRIRETRRILLTSRKR